MLTGNFLKTNIIKILVCIPIQISLKKSWTQFGIKRLLAFPEAPSRQDGITLAYSTPVKGIGVRDLYLDFYNYYYYYCSAIFGKTGMNLIDILICYLS